MELQKVRQIQLRLRVIIIFALALLSLACSMSAMSSAAVAEATLTKPADGGDVATNAPAEICARVVSQGALHLRSAADPTARVVAYLQPDHVVVVVDQLDSRWWRVADGGLDGYARASFLEVVSCETEELSDGDE